MKEKITHKREPKTCWEYWDCPEKIKKECPAYKSDKGDECWLLASYYHAENCPSKNPDKGILGCLDCPWYKKFEPYRR